MLRYFLFATLICVGFNASSQLEKKIKPTVKQKTVWRLLAGYPKESKEYTEAYKKFVSINPNGSVSVKGYSESLKRELVQTVTFKPFKTEYEFGEDLMYDWNAKNTDHEHANEVNALGGSKLFYTNKAETYYHEVGLGGVSCDLGSYIVSHDWRDTGRHKLDKDGNECFIIAVGGGNYYNTCQLLLWKYEKIQTTDETNIDCNYLPDIRACNKTLFVSGKKADGTKTITSMDPLKLFYDYCANELEKQAAYFSDVKYKGFDYTLIAPASMRQDCAGYVFEKFWADKGKLRFNGNRFYQGIIEPFGTDKGSLQDNLTDVQKGDIVVYMKDGIANHIAYVKEVITDPMIGTRIVIETKDGSEPVYITTITIGKLKMNDPLVEKHGVPRVFRINPNNIEIVDKKQGDCD